MRFKNPRPKFNNTENKHINYEGKEVWFSRSVAVVGFVTLDVEGIEYVLVNKRGKGVPDFQGFWNLPCGYLDQDETLLEAVSREIFEETGLNVTEDFFTSDQPVYVHSDPKDSNRQNISMYFDIHANVTPEEFERIKACLTTEHCEPNEVADIRFINTDDIDDYMFCFNHDKRIKKLL